MKTTNYKGKGEHSVNELELIIEKQAEELHLIKSGQKPLIIDSVREPFLKWGDVTIGFIAGVFLTIVILGQIFNAL
jgi:hypothetical protein